MQNYTLRHTKQESVGVLLVIIVGSFVTDGATELWSGKLPLQAGPKLIQR